jgi:hypothetical protein
MGQKKRGLVRKGSPVFHQGSSQAPSPSQSPAVMVNFMCQIDWATTPNFWLDISLQGNYEGIFQFASK